MRLPLHTKAFRFMGKSHALHVPASIFRLNLSSQNINIPFLPFEKEQSIKLCTCLLLNTVALLLLL